MSIIYGLKAEKMEHFFTISDLKGEGILLKSQIDNMTKMVRMLNNSSNVFDEILQSRKNAGNFRDIGFDNEDVKNKEKKSEVKFIKEKEKQE